MPRSRVGRDYGNARALLRADDCKANGGVMLKAIVGTGGGKAMPKGF